MGPDLWQTFLQLYKQHEEAVGFPQPKTQIGLTGSAVLWGLSEGLRKTELQNWKPSDLDFTFCTPEISIKWWKWTFHPGYWEPMLDIRGAYHIGFPICLESWIQTFDLDFCKVLWTPTKLIIYSIPSIREKRSCNHILKKISFINSHPDLKDAFKFPLECLQECSLLRNEKYRQRGFTIQGDTD
jgi:hypothetical protein